MLFPPSFFACSSCRLPATDEPLTKRKFSFSASVSRARSLPTNFRSPFQTRCSTRGAANLSHLACNIDGSDSKRSGREIEVNGSKYVSEAANSVLQFQWDQKRARRNERYNLTKGTSFIFEAKTFKRLRAIFGIFSTERSIKS